MAHLVPDLDYEKYRKSYEYLSSAIDTSDGLVIDASRIAAASGVGIDIRVEALINAPEFSELESASGSRESALESALYGGEDHLFLLFLAELKDERRCKGTYDLILKRYRGPT